MYNSNFLKLYYLYLKISILFNLSHLFSRFLKSETSLNFSHFDRQDFF